MEECNLAWSWYQVAKDFLPSLATLIVAYLSIRFAVLQIKQQHQNALDLQTANRKKDIQIELFEAIQVKLDGCSSIASQLSSSLIFKTTYLENGVDVNHNEAEFEQELSKVMNMITDVTIYIEYREIVSPRLFRVVRSALHSTHHDLLEVLKGRDIDLVQRYRDASKAAGEASSYCHDLNACLQNHAFGDLFENAAPIRQPIDSNEKVIVDEDEALDRLLQYFEHETPYGRQMDAVNQQVREEFGQD
jgi:hypothetical protein